MRVRACGEPTDRNFAPHGSAPPLMNQRVPPYSGCMSSLPFDTHRAVKALCEAGTTETLAEAFVETIGDAITGNIATKADIAASEVALRADISGPKLRSVPRSTNPRPPSEPRLPRGGPRLPTFGPN